jgi:cell division protein FtsW
MGLFFIFDAGYARSLGTNHGVWPAEFRNQLIALPIAVGFGWVCSMIKPKAWLNLSLVALAICAALLVFVLKVGHEINGAKRWIWSVQPSEFAKVAVVLFLASVFAFRKPWPKIPKFKNWPWWLDHVAVPKVVRALPALAVAVVVLLVDKEPDMGTAMVIAATVLVLFVLGGVSNKSLMAVGFLVVVGGWFVVRSEPYRMERILNHSRRWDPSNIDDISYQSVQSELAMASGGLTGIGIGNGRAKQIIPEPTTDFIMATVGEEFGLFGSLIVLGVLSAIALRMVWLAGRTKNRFGSLFLYGIATWIGFQASVNFMMANAFLPAIGVPLPFISYGGSSLFALWCAIGIGLSLVAQPAPKRVVEGADVARPAGRVVFGR